MDNSISLNSIAGYKSAKAEALKIINVLKHYDEYVANGAYMPKGLILSGEPGVGKTMLAKVIAAESGVKLYTYGCDNTVDDIDNYAAIMELFNKAKENKPSIVLIDELDEMVDMGHFISDESRTITKALLTTIDGITSSDGIFIIATTNRYGALPPSLTRSGRMDKKIIMQCPDEDERKEIFDLYLKDKNGLSELDSNELAAETQGCTGADIKTIVNECLCAYIESDKTLKIDNEFAERQIRKVISEDIEHEGEVKDFVLYHELGHAVTLMEINKTIPSLTSICQGYSEGMTTFRVEEDMNIKDIMDQMVVAFGGYVAEEAKFGQPGLGCKGDLDKAEFYFLKAASLGFDGRWDLTVPAIDLAGRSMPRLTSKGHEELSIRKSQAHDYAKVIVDMYMPFIEYMFPIFKRERVISKDRFVNIIKKYISLNPNSPVRYNLEKALKGFAKSQA